MDEVKPKQNEKSRKVEGWNGDSKKKGSNKLEYKGDNGWKCRWQRMRNKLCVENLVERRV